MVVEVVTSDAGNGNGNTGNNNGNGWTGADAIGLLNVFEHMLLAMERRLVEKMDDNSELAAERWDRHDKDSERTLKAIEDRFEKVHGLIKTVDETLAAHLKKERDEDLVNEIRVQPIVKAVRYVIAHWRTALLIIVSILAILGFSGETLNRLLGH